MKNFKKTIAGVSALSMAMSLAACGGSAEEQTEAVTKETTTQATVEVNTATLAEDDQQTLDEVAAANLRDVELENKTIKWLAHYDINPSGSGQSESVPLNLFKSKYGGSVEYIPTTWDSRYSDLSTHVLGGDGVDFFPCDTAALPKGVINGMFQPVDEYIDMDSPLWEDVKSAMEIYNFNGKHYELVNNVSAENIILYNKQTIEENGLDDPWELYKAGEWNWDTFTKMLEQYVDPDNDHYGLDGYWNEKALLLSAGVPSVSSDNGTLKVNLTDPPLKRLSTGPMSLIRRALLWICPSSTGQSSLSLWARARSFST